MSKPVKGRLSGNFGHESKRTGCSSRAAPFKSSKHVPPFPSKFWKAHHCTHGSQPRFLPTLPGQALLDAGELEAAAVYSEAVELVAVDPAAMYKTFFDNI